MSYQEQRLGEIFPEWFLTKGEWDSKPVLGLSTGGRPELLFDLTQIPGGGRVVGDPFFGMSDREIASVPDDDAVQAQYDLYLSQVDYFEDQMYCLPIVGYYLMTGAFNGGYDPKEHGHRVAGWIVQRIAEIMNDCLQPAYTPE